MFDGHVMIVLGRRPVARYGLLIMAAALGLACRPSPPVNIRSVTPGSITPEQSHRLMVEVLDALAEYVDDQNIYLGRKRLRALRDDLALLDPNDATVSLWAKLCEVAQAELEAGEETASLQHFEKAASVLATLPPSAVSSDQRAAFYFQIAVAYLRWGETRNCCQTNEPDSCIIPFRGKTIHADPRGAEGAIEWLTLLLTDSSLDTTLQLQGRWLLNLSYMTLGRYPRDVSPEWLIPQLDEPTQTDIGHWENVAAPLSVATRSVAGGAVADDFDNDGMIDLIVSSFDPREPLHVMWNRGDGSFDDGSMLAGVDGIRGGLNLVHADYDNDGYLDLLVLRGGWLAERGQHPNSLLRNNGDRTFTDVTIRSGLERSRSYPTQTASWADYDLDGDLDLYIGNESSRAIRAPCQLFRNEGNGTFRDVALQAGVTNDRMAKGVVWGDFNHDRYPDLYVSNYRAPNRLFRNRGDGTFEDVAQDLGVDLPLSSFPCWFWDANQDGMMDLFVGAYAGGIAELAASRLGDAVPDETLPRLWLGRPDHGFDDASRRWGLTRPSHPMGSNFGDLDNDGYPDAYLGTGWPEFHELMPNVVLLNRGNRFLDVAIEARMSHLQKGHAVACADFDRDGDLDLFEQMGGFVPGDSYYDVLYRNPGHNRHWLTIALVGETSNRFGVGCHLHVRVDGHRSIHGHVSSGGTFGGNPFEQHLGLGNAETIDYVEVDWPCSGQVVRYHGIPIDSAIIIREGETEWSTR